jgi:hypothetical protein
MAPVPACRVLDTTRLVRRVFLDESTASHLFPASGVSGDERHLLRCVDRPSPPPHGVLAPIGAPGHQKVTGLHNAQPSVKMIRP